MRKFGKVVAGFPYSSEKGEFSIPPKKTMEMSIKDNKEWLEVPIQKVVKRETER